MVKLLGLTLPGTDSSNPREIAGAASTATASNGWLIRFFDSSFFSPWIAVSYLYKHDHAGVRDYLCNRMYALPLPALEPYLFQLCYMLVHKPSPSLDKFLVDTCGKSLRIALKVHWFLLAEVESSEDDGIAHVQEECQIAATVTADWPLLVRTAPVPASPRMLNRIFSWKESGSVGKSVEKVRDALSFRKSVEKEEEEEDRDGFFRRLLSASKEENAEKDGVFRQDEGVASSSDGMFRRLFRDKEGKLGEEEKKDEEITSSSYGVIKKLFRDKEERLGEEQNKDEETVSSSDEVIKRLFRDEEQNLDEEVVSCKRLFRDKEDNLGDEDKKDEDVASSSGRVIKRLFCDEEEKLGEKGEDGFVKRLFRDKEEKLGGQDKREGFFHKMFKEKKDGGHADGYKGRESVEDDDRESFFKKLFKDKHEEKKLDGPDRSGEEDKGDETMMEEKEGFFRKIFKGGEKKDACDGEKEGEDKARGSVEDDDKQGLFKRIFKDRHDEKKVARHDQCEEEDRRIGSVEDGEKEGFFKTLFKVRNDDRKDQGHHRNEVYNKANGRVEEETSEFLSFRRLFRVHSEVVEHTTTSRNGNPGAPFESSPGTENIFKRLFSDRDRSVEDSELLRSKKLKELKDRHNGNLLMDEEGHIIHIDFGFLLSDSPGRVNFESAPFKLTRELLEAMDSDADGNPSDFFDYFKVLCIQGFLICRKHAERIILLVEMLQMRRRSFPDILFSLPKG